MVASPVSRSRVVALSGGRDPNQTLPCLLTGRQGRRAPQMVPTTTEPMDRRIAQLALARFRIAGFAGTSIADLAGALGISKAAIYYHYRSKDALLHHLIDPLLDAIDTCIHHHPTPPPTPPTPRQLLDAYLAVLLTHREVVPLITTDPAVLHHPTIGPRLHTQHQQLHSLLAAPNTTLAASLRAEAALGAIRRPLIAQPPLDLTDPTHQHILIDAAVATLQPSQPTPDGTPLPAPHSNPHTEEP
jgi:AcrR family transcriptional regulator